MAGPKSEASALDRLLDLRSEIEGRLLENADYKTLVALDRAIADITGDASPMLSGSAPLATTVKSNKGQTADVSGLSQPDAAFVLLQKVLGEPQIIANLVKALNAHGVRVGGAQPNINLSSVLSKDARFRSVRYKDRACWWIEGTPFPSELDAH